MTSVMWNSLRIYTEQNASILEDVFEKNHDAWCLTLDWDLAQVCGKDGFQFFENLKQISPESAQAAEFAQSVREQQIDKDAIFLNLRRWLTRFSEAPSTPTNIGNFAAMAEVLFWIGHLDIQTPLRDSFTDHVLDQATDELPIHLLGEFILGVRTCRPDLYDQWLSEHIEHLTTRLRQEAAILALVEDDEAVVAHYVLDIDQKTARLRPRDNFSNSTNTLHESTLERIELLSQVFAGKKRYGAIGYGHRTSIVGQIVDEAEKPGVMAEYLHPPWAPRFNALARGLVEHRFRPDSWMEYFRILQTRRQDILSALGDLRRAITAFNPTRKPSDKFGLQRPTQWDECRNSLSRPLLLPKVAVDEWGFITESTEQNRTDDIRRLRYPALNRLSPIRDAVNEYTRTVGNFMSQALDGLVLLPNLHMAEDPSIKANVLAKAAEFGIDEHSVRLSIVNGVNACAAVAQLHTATYDVFDSSSLPNTSDAMASRERQVFLSTVTSWCTFAYGGSATHRQQVAKKSHLRKPKKNNPQKSGSTQPKSFSDLLNPTRNRLRIALRGLKRDGIEASILSETVPWNGKSALWISCNTDHPLDSLAAIEKTWYQLVAVFDPDRDKIVRIKAIDLLWSAIILVPLVSGKSLEGHALPHFRGVADVQTPDLEHNPWYLFPEIIPEDVWDQLRLKRWEADSRWSTFDQFTTAYGMLFQHIDHLADFKRLLAELDDLGISIVQSYIDNEMIRIQPLFQEVLDSYSKILNIFNETDPSVIDQRHNLIDCMKALIEIKDYLLQIQEFYQWAELSLDQLADWSNQLRDGLQILGVARSLWIADTLHFGEYNDV